MSTTTRMVVVIVVFLGCFAALAWLLAGTVGYGFRATLLTSLGVYIGILLLYAGSRRIMNRRRSRRGREPQSTA